MTDRTPKPCLCQKADHEHGTRWAYMADECRCWPCVYAYNAWDRARRARAKNGRPGLVPAEPVRAHIRAHMEAGATLTQIAREAGITIGSVHGVLYGGRSMMLASIADEILAVQLVENAILGPAVVVPSIGARRRVQALARVGWSQIAIAEHSGVCARTIDELSWRPGVLACNHQSIAETYDALWDKEPPTGTCYQRASVTKIRRAAERKGWPPPMAWDDETIDNADATPQTGEPAPVVKPDHTARFTMYEQGMSDRAIARHEHVSADTIRYWRISNNLPSNHNPNTATPLGEEDDNRYALWQQGLTDRQISEKVGRHPDVIRRWRLKHGLQGRRSA